MMSNEEYFQMKVNKKQSKVSIDIKPKPTEIKSDVSKTNIQSNVKQGASINKSAASKVLKEIDEHVQIVKPKVQKKPNPTKRMPVPAGKSKLEDTQKIKWSTIPFSCFYNINKYASDSPFEVYQLSRVCMVWRHYLQSEEALYLWKNFQISSKVRNFKELKQCLMQQLLSQKEKVSHQFQRLFTKLFSYGSTKQNIPNKLIAKLNLQVSVQINGKNYPRFAFKQRNFNFSSYLYLKANELSECKFDFATPHNMFKDKLKIRLKFYSKTFKVGHIFEQSYLPQQIAECAIRQKAFNYFIDKNLIITFFDGDSNFLYFFYEISALELILAYRNSIKNQHREHLKQKAKKIPLHKQLCETEFQSFVQYLKYQSDFEVHLSYHNSVKQIFTHCDTKVYPREYDQHHAYFQVKINDSFQKCSTFKLDNKMGISENVPDLYLLDFVLKDRDKFLISFSGFIFAKEASQQERETIEDFFQFADYNIKVLNFADRAKHYDLQILIIDEPHKNFVPKIKFNLYNKDLYLQQ